MRGSSLTRQAAEAAALSMAPSSLLSACVNFVANCCDMRVSLTYDVHPHILPAGIFASLFTDGAKSPLRAKMLRRPVKLHGERSNQQLIVVPKAVAIWKYALGVKEHSVLVAPQQVLADLPVNIG